MTYPILLLAVALGGKPVAIPSDAEPSTKLAASELTNYLFRITGKSSEVKVEGMGGQWNFSSIVVGTLKSLGEAVPAVAKDDPGDYVPRDADLAVADFAEFREPKFKIRRLDACRSRVFRGEFAHTEEHYSIGGIGFLSTAQYHPFVIGEPKR